MSYIGRTPQQANYDVIDTIAASFNGSTTSFELKKNSEWLSIGTENQLTISLGGVVQEPGVAYTIDNTTPLQSNIVFSTAPDLGMNFWGRVYGETLDAGKPSGGSVTPSEISAGYNIIKNWTVHSSPVTAVNGSRIMADTNAGSFDVTLPLAPVDGAEVDVLDYRKTWNTNPINIKISVGSGHFIENGVDTTLTGDVNGAKIKLIYSSADNYWRVY